VPAGVPAGVLGGVLGGALGGVPCVPRGHARRVGVPRVCQRPRPPSRAQPGGTWVLCPAAEYQRRLDADAALLASWPAA
jgi:hypothetical protein